MGDSSIILHSTDAGETWKQVSVLPENDRTLLDIAFRGSLGYLTGNYATIYKTEDFGVTWIQQTIVDQPNSSVNAYSINIMENTTYIITTDPVYPYTYTLYETVNKKNWTSKCVFNTSTSSGLYPFFLNDSVGYYSDVMLTTGGGSGNLSVMKTIDGGENWEANAVGGVFGREVLPSKIRMINDTTGYAIFGQVLMKIPAPKNLSDSTGIKEIKDEIKFSILQTSLYELTLKSESNPIKSLDIFDISGQKWIHQQWQNPIQEVNLNVGNLPKGIYLINALFTDKTGEAIKWINR